MSHRVRVRLAALERLGRIHTASLTTRCPSAEFGVDRASSFDAIVSDDKVDAVAIATQ